MANISDDPSDKIILQGVHLELTAAMQNISPKRHVWFLGADDETRCARSQFELAVHAAPSGVLQKVAAH